jgi:hypothetical protein
MPTHFDDKLDLLIIFIIFIKIIFVISAAGHIILSHSSNAYLHNKIDPKLLYWKERTEFIFVASMSILLIYYFKPGQNRPITQESAILFFLFGWILLFTAKWSLFFTEAPWYQKLVKSWN